MAIPNTTPTPNELYNGEMKRMNDTELRVVLVVTRKTLGWELDPKTKTRKKEDWIARSQIIQQTGRSGRAISTAIENCIKNHWIEARDINGKLLNTPQKRSGKKIFYRLGRIFLSKIASEEISQVKKDNKTSEESSLEPVKKVHMKKVHTTKENAITKETITKDVATSKVAGLNLLIERFKKVNPSYERLFSNKTQRAALERMVKKHGKEKVENMIDYLPKIFGKPYAPVIFTPYQLENKLGQLISFIKKNQCSDHRRRI